MFLIIIFIVLFLIIYYINHKTLIKSQEFTINRLIKLDNKYKIKIEIIKKEENDIVKNVILFENEREIDPEIVQYAQFQFSYYFSGENGYYIFNKITRKLITYENLNSFNKKQKRIFEKYFY